jgi:hypothetical protein
MCVCIFLRKEFFGRFITQENSIVEVYYILSLKILDEVFATQSSKPSVIFSASVAESLSLCRGHLIDFGL